MTTPKQVIKIYETNPDKPNHEGKRQMVMEIVGSMSEEHISWLHKLLVSKYTPKEIIKTGGK